MVTILLANSLLMANNSGYRRRWCCSSSQVPMVSITAIVMLPKKLHATVPYSI
jgi:hypothetical protein